MTSKAKYFLIILSIIFIVFLISGCTTPTGEVVKEEENKVVKFGVIASLTGEAAQWGEALQKGMTLAQKELANKNTYFNYEFIIEDDQLQNAKTVSAFHKLTSVDDVNAIVSFSSGSGNAIAPLAEQNKVITCSVASDPAIVKDRKYVFKHWVTPEAEAEKYVEEAKRRGFKTIGIISSNQQGILAVTKILKEIAPEMILFEEVIEPDAKDFRTVILKAKSQNPDTLVSYIMPGGITAFMRQLHELSYTGDVSSIEMFEFEEEAIPYLEGRWYINTAEEKGKFKEMYEAEYSKKPLVASGNAYDCIMLIVLAYEKAKTQNPDLVVRELHKIKDYEGALGKIYVDEGNSVQSPAVVKEVRNGEFVVLEPTKGAPSVTSSEELKIGWIGPLTGDTASYGIPMKQAADLAVEEINNAGGVNGRQIKIIYEDGKCNGKDASIAANKLVNVDGVKIINSLCSAETLGIAPITESAKVIVFSAAAGSPDVSYAGDYVFRNFPSDLTSGSKVAEYAASKGHKKFAIISEQSDYSQGLRKVFLETLVAEGGEAVVDETFSSGLSDFRTQLTKIKYSDIDAVYIITQRPSDYGLILKQYHELKIVKQIYTNEFAAGKDILKDYGKEIEGAIYAEPIFDENSLLAVALFDKLEQKYGQLIGVLPPIYVATAYDAINLQIDAVKKCGENTDCIRDFFYEVEDWKGTAGKLSIDENGDPLFEYEVKIIKDNKPAKLE